MEQLILELSDSRELAQTYGGYIRNCSRLRVRLVSPDGMEPESSVITCGGTAAPGPEAVFGLPNAGQVDVSAVAVYPDGTRLSTQTRISVLAYDAPTVEIQALERCDAAGNPDSQGELGLVRFSGTVSPLPGGNPAAYSLQYRARGQTEWVNLALTRMGSGSVENAQAVFSANPGLDYEVRLRVEDTFSLGLSGFRRLPTAFALADFSREKRAIGLGMRSDLPDTLGIGLDVAMYGHRLRGLPEPEEDTQAVNLGYARANFWMPRLLWQNPAPTAAFQPQALSLDFSNVRFLAVEHKTGDNCSLQFFPKGTGGTLWHGTKSRALRSSDSGLSFFAAQDNADVVPVKVYGL